MPGHSPWHWEETPVKRLHNNNPWGYLFRNVNVLRIHWPPRPLTAAPLGFPIKHSIKHSTSSLVPLPSTLATEIDAAGMYRRPFAAGAGWCSVTPSPCASLDLVVASPLMFCFQTVTAMCTLEVNVF